MNLTNLMSYTIFIFARILMMGMCFIIIIIFMLENKHLKLFNNFKNLFIF